MRRTLSYAPLPLPPLPLSPPPPAPPCDTDIANNPQKLLASVFLTLLLPLAGMSAIFILYILVLWFHSGDEDDTNHTRLQPPRSPDKAVANGLSAAELEKLPKFTGKELRVGTECAVCLEEIGDDEPVRVVPGCNHGFHVHCADSWLSRRSVCPICRGKLELKAFDVTVQTSK